MPNVPNDIIDKAFNIAVQSLRECYTSKGIMAGKKHFDDYWARDSFFASLGSIAIGDYSTAKKNILLFSNAINKNGQIPLRIGAYDMRIKLFVRFFRIKTKFAEVPRYTDDKAKNTAMDQNSLFIISAAELLKHDRKLIKQPWPVIERACNWNLNLSKQNSEGLLEEKAYSSWEDSLRKQGMVLYTNIVFWKSLVCMTEICTAMKNKTGERLYKKTADEVGRAINKMFWNSRFYSDVAQHRNIMNKKNKEAESKENKSKERENKENKNGEAEYEQEDRQSKKALSEVFSADGNFLAVWWSLADKNQSKSILMHAKKVGICTVPCKTNVPSYPSSLVSPTIRFFGAGNYHNNGMSWLWLGCVYAQALSRAGMKKQAVSTIESIAQIICSAGSVPEVVDQNGKPIERFFYKSEMPFAWSAGMFIKVCSDILDR